MDAFAQVLDRYSDHIQYRNTWGNTLYVVFESVSSTTCGAQLQQTLCQLPLTDLDFTGPESRTKQAGIGYIKMFYHPYRGTLACL